MRGVSTGCLPSVGANTPTLVGRTPAAVTVDTSVYGTRNRWCWKWQFLFKITSASQTLMSNILSSCARLICHRQPRGEYEKQTDRVARLSLSETGPQSLLCEWRSVADNSAGGRSGNRRGSGLIPVWQIEWHLPWSRALAGWGGCDCNVCFLLWSSTLAVGPPIYSRDRMWMVCPVSLFIPFVILVFFLLRGSSLSFPESADGKMDKALMVSFPSLNAALISFLFKRCKNVFSTLIFSTHT